MAKPKKTEENDAQGELIVLNKKAVKDLVSVDLKPELVAELKKAAGTSIEFKVTEGEASLEVEMTSMANRHTKNTPCGKISITDGMAVTSFPKGNGGENTFKKATDLEVIAWAILTDAITYLLEVSETVRKAELADQVKVLTERLKLNPNDVIEDLDEEAYHAGPGVSKSMLDALAISCTKLDLYLKSKKKPSPDMILGSAFHDLLLRPELFYTLNYITPDVPKQSREDKFTHLMCSLVNFGKRGISNDQLDVITKARDSINAHPLASHLVKEGLKELSFYCQTQPVQGGEIILMRGRADGLILNPSPKLVKVLEQYIDIPDNAIIIYDPKLLRDNGDEEDEEDQLGRMFLKSKYHRQAFNYTDIIEKFTNRPVVFIYIAVTKDGTFDVIPSQLDSAAMELGEKQIRKLQVKYVTKFLTKDGYRGRCAGIKSIGFPLYAFKDSDIE